MKDTFSHLPTIPVIRLAVRTGNPQRLHRIAPDGDFAETEADVLVLDLLPGEKPPAGVAGFGGALLVLTDDPRNRRRTPVRRRPAARRHHRPDRRGHRGPRRRG